MKTEMKVDLFKVFPGLQDEFEKALIEKIEEIKDKWLTDMRLHNEKVDTLLKEMKQYIQYSAANQYFYIHPMDVQTTKELKKWLEDKK